MKKILTVLTLLLAMFAFSGVSFSAYQASTTSTGGFTIIEAEDFDAGADGVAYHDTTADNSGTCDYREDTGVDVAVNDPAAGCHVGHTQDGEWTNYTWNFPLNGTYTISLYVASTSEGANGIFTVDGQQSQTFNVPQTPTWHSFVPVDVTATVTAGSHTMRVAQGSVHFTFDLMVIKPPGIFQKVGVQWDPNEPAPEGYRVFERPEGQSYDYANPRSVTAYPNGNILSPMVKVNIEGIRAEPGVITKIYWIVRAYDGDLESADSEEVSMEYDRTAPPSANNLVAEYDRAKEEITFTWDQAETTKVDHWDIFYTETPGQDYVKLDTVKNTGQVPGLTAPITIVPAGERKTVYFAIVSFRDAEVFSANSAEVEVDINRIILQPPGGVKTFVVTIPVQ